MCEIVAGGGVCRVCVLCVPCVFVVVRFYVANNAKYAQHFVSLLHFAVSLWLSFL